MTPITAFARRHVVLARFIITAIHILLFFAAVVLANNLRSFGVVLPLQVFLYCICAFLLLAINRKKINAFIGQKALFFLVGLLMFTSLTCYFNNDSFRQVNNYPTAEGVTSVSEKPMTKKEARKKFRSAVKEIKKSLKKQGNAGKVILTILVILLALGLLAALAALSCSIACNTSGVLALIVFLAGLAGIVLLFLWAIRMINRKNSAPRKQPPAGRQI